MKDKEVNLSAYFAASSREDWQEAVEATLKGKPISKLHKKKAEGFVVEPIYASGGEHFAHQGYPDLPPFTRGSGVLDRRQAGWDIRQLHESGTLEEGAKAIQEDLQRGVRSLWLRPSSDTQNSQKESFFRSGLHIQNLADLEKLLGSTDLSSVPVAIEAGAHGPGFLALLAAFAQKHGHKESELIGSIHFDPIGTLAQEGNLPQGIEGAWRDLSDLLLWSKEHTPWLHTFSMSGLPYHESGANAAQELSYILASTAQTLRALEQHNVNLEDLAGRCVVQVGIGRDLFIEIAKVRALRMLWAQLWQACGLPEANQTLFIHASTSRTTQSTRDPWVNILRGTAECFSAAVGGVDAITIIPFDRPFGHPEPLSQRIASNSQKVLEQEAYLGKVADPAGGSWYIESITQQLAQQAWTHFQHIESKGGMLAYLQSGSVAEELSQQIASKNQDLAKRKAPILGLSEFANLEEERLTRPAISESQPQSERQGSKEQAISGETAEERLAACIQAVSDGTSAQAITKALHPNAEVTEITPLSTYRLAAQWERIRTNSESFLKRTGKAFTVFLANIGPIPSHKARATFAQRFFEAGGFKVLTNDGFSDMAEAAKAFAESGANGVAICGSDKDYTAHTQVLASALSAANPSFVTVAGRPGEQAEDWENAGVTDYIFLGCNALETLHTLQEKAGTMEEN